MSGEGGGLIKGPLVEAKMQFRLQPGGRKSGAGCFVNCPKCEQPAFIRRSERVTPTVTQMTCHCTNSGCGHTYRADIVFVHSLVEGNVDRPDLGLPVCPRDQVEHVVPPSGERHADEPSFFDPENEAA